MLKDRLYIFFRSNVVCEKKKTIQYTMKFPQ